MLRLSQRAVTSPFRTNTVIVSKAYLSRQRKKIESSMRPKDICNAIDFKKRIETASETQQCLGRVYDMEQNFRKYHWNGYQDYDRESRYVKIGYIQFDSNDIMVPGISNSNTYKFVEKLYNDPNLSRPVGCGDVLKQETHFDGNPREVTNFTVENSLLEKIAEEWSERFNFKLDSIRVVPHKINLYKEGDFFSPHQDTPELGQCGTFLLRLFTTYEEESATGQSHSHARWDDQMDICGYAKWDSARGANYCAFYPDVTHYVAPIASEYRALVAFKIFSEGGGDKSLLPTLQKVENGLPQSRAPFGIILSHHYSFCTEPSMLKGIDLAMYTYMSQRYKSVKLFPSLIIEDGSWSGDDDDKYEARVYDLSRSVDDLDTKSDLQFYRLSKNMFCWSKKYHEYKFSDKPGIINGIYLNLAMIIH